VRVSKGKWISFPEGKGGHRKWGERCVGRKSTSLGRKKLQTGEGDVSGEKAMLPILIQGEGKGPFKKGKQKKGSEREAHRERKVFGGNEIFSLNGHPANFVDEE